MEFFSQILAADDARYCAMIANDLSALSSLLDAELLYTHSSAVTETKEEYLESLRSGRVVYHSATRSREILRASEGAVVMVGHVIIKATVDGIDRILDNRFTTVWVKKHQTWNLLAWASTPTPKVMG
ncbi:nuclear transport factor 2 family protein [Paraburkholderia tagetis]|uniref:Nuclear transport factor 2 family protein n=1 Tax=Paraburkholderia tagetis TaxID=2913261 RepID=A0A9X1UPP1_9BURK|nr:nuclear transport factor 2 family protein [Paraburkholderia tagetis]MCG5079087.1 nuclear transport factor 2 family protein [Paraburkholderia tagetis]